MFAVVVADQCAVLALSVVGGEAEDLAGVPGAFKNCPDEHVLIATERCDLLWLDVFMAPR